jgi:ribonuclease E
MFKAMAAANGGHDKDDEDGTDEAREQKPEEVAETDSEAIRTAVIESGEDDIEDLEDEDFDESEDDSDSDDDEDEIDLDSDDDDDDMDDDIEVIGAEDDSDDEYDDSDDSDDSDDDDATEAPVSGGRHRRRAAARPAGPPTHER